MAVGALMPILSAENIALIGSSSPSPTSPRSTPSGTMPNTPHAWSCRWWS